MAVRNLKYGPLNVASYEPVSSAKIKESKNTVDTLTVGVNSSTPFVLGDTINFYNEDEVLKFVGTITKIDQQVTFYTLEIQSLANILTTQVFSNVYRNQSPEAIIEDIIANQTTLTFSSTISTGVTLTKQVFRDTKLIDAITKMTESFNGTFTVSKAGVFTLTRRFANASSVSLNNATDVLQGKWKTDANKKYTKIIVEGANIDQRTTETFSGSFTQVTLSAIPKDIQITNGGGTVLTQTTTNINGDYSVDAQNKTVDFDSSQSNPTVDYTYDSQVRVEIGTGNTLKLQKSYIEDTNTALQLALSALNLYQDGVQTGKWLKTDGSDHEDVSIGESVLVTDSVNNVSGTFELQGIVFEYPNRLILTVGEEEDSLFDWQKENQQRVEELEQKDQNSEFVTKFDYNNNELNVSVGSAVITFQKRGLSNQIILDSPPRNTVDSIYALDGQPPLVFDGGTTFDEDYFFDGVAAEWETLQPSKIPLRLPFSLN